MLILSGSTPLYVLLLRGSGTPRYRPSSGCPSGGSYSTTISTLLIAARRSAGKEFSASSIASSNGSWRPGSERASISAMVPESVLGYRRLLLGGFVAAVAELTELAALWPGDVTWKSSFSHRNSTCRRLTVTSSRKLSLRGCRPTEVTG
jgi:hypothetical protein